MKILRLELHKYASELNTLVLKNGINIKVPNVKTIKEAREKLFKQVKHGKYCKIEFIYSNGWSNKTYEGYYNSYSELLKFKNELMKKHTLGIMKISLSYKG